MNINDYNEGYAAYNEGFGQECLRGRSASFDEGFWAAHNDAFDEYVCEESCIEQGVDCEGEVDYRPAMSPTGKSFPRCEGHYEARLRTQNRIVRDYGGQMFYGNY